MKANRIKKIEKKIRKINLIKKSLINFLKKELKGFKRKEIEYIFTKINIYISSEEKKVIYEYLEKVSHSIKVRNVFKHLN